MSDIFTIQLKDAPEGALADILIEKYGLDEERASGIERLSRQFGAADEEEVGQLLKRMELDGEIEVREQINTGT